MVFYRNPYDEGGDFQAPGDFPPYVAPPGQPAPPASPSVPDPIPGVGSGGNGGGGGGGGNARPIFNFENAPDFNAPQFVRPTLQDAQNEPGYQFRLGGGQQALERSAAARGLLRSGGTLKDLTEYGQNFATQEYGNVFNRALSGFDREYRGAYDSYRSQYDPWALRSGAEIQAAMAQFANQNRNRGGGGGGGGEPPWMPPLPPEPETHPGYPYGKSGKPPIF